MHADELRGPAGHGGELRDRDRRRVGRDDGACAGEPVDLLQDAQLEVEVFGGGLHDELHRRELRVIRRSGDAGERGLAGVARDLFLLLQPLEARIDRGEAAVDGRLRDIDHDDVDAGRSARLRDAVAHGSGADDADALDVHRDLLSIRRSHYATRRKRRHPRELRRRCDTARAPPTLPGAVTARVSRCASDRSREAREQRDHHAIAREDDARQP